MFRHRPLVAASLLLLALAIGACSPAPDPLAGRSVLDRAVTADPESLDPQRGRSTQSNEVLRDIGEGLLGYSPSGELVPAAAESWRISDDALTYTFKLRDDARWSNGEPVVAGDFERAFRRLVDPATAAFYAGQMTMIDNAAAIVEGRLPAAELGVEAIDEQTLQIRLNQPTPYLLQLLTHPSTFPVNPRALDEHGDDFARPGLLPSNGAYVLAGWQAGALLELHRNEHYWNRDNVAIDVVRYHVITEESVELNRYRAGELHVTTNVPPEAFARVREERPDELHVVPYLGVYYYGFNLTKPPFRDNLPLRQALSMAVDRELLVEKITGRGEAPAYSWVPPGISNYSPPPLSFAHLSQDERNAIARSLYEKAGYSVDKPASIELRYNTSDTQRRIALAIQSMWKDVLGVETTLINEEFQVLLNNMREREVTQVFRSSWIGDFNDPVNFLGVLQPGAASNLPGYASEEFEQLMQDAARQTDPERRRLFLEEAERVLLADHAVIPLYFYVSKQLVSPEVGGWGDNILNYHYSQHLSLEETEG